MNAFEKLCDDLWLYCGYTGSQGAAELKRLAAENAALRSAAQQALDALEQCWLDESYRNYAKESAAITALRERLAQPVCCCQEPDAPGIVHRTDGPCYMREQPVQEPVAYLYTNVQSGDIEASTDPDWSQGEREYWHQQPLYTPLQPREFVGLTLEEMDEIIDGNIKITDSRLRDGVYGAVLDTIITLMEKNT